MADFTLNYEIRGTNRVANQLRAAAKFQADKADPIISKHAKATQKKLRKTPYPSYLPHFTHERRGFFGGIAGSFSAQKRKKGVWVVTNSRPYAMAVIGAMAQKKQHPSFLRWYEMAKVAGEDNKELTRELSKALDAELDNAND